LSPCKVQARLFARRQVALTKRRELAALDIGAQIANQQRDKNVSKGMAIAPTLLAAEQAPVTDPRFSSAFPTLTPAQVEALMSFGKEQTFEANEDVWHAGQPNLCMFLVLEGEMSIVDGRTGHYIASHFKGQFSGDVDVLSGRPSLVTAQAAAPLRVLVIPADCVRAIVGEQPDLGEVILRAFLVRRALLQECEGVGPLVLGSRYSPDTLRIREFLARNRYPHTWQDLENTPEVAIMLKEFEVTEEDTPVVVLPDGSVVKVPSNAQLAAALGVQAPIETTVYDLVVIGAGPAGLAAGVYGGSEGLSTLIIDEFGPGGQAGTSSRIENYMGFPLGLTGQDLADRAVAQAEKFGAKMLVPAKVSNVSCSTFGTHIVDLGEMGKVEAHCVILATGASYRKLDIEGFDRFEGRGIYYSATVVEQILCSDNAVAVVGAGNSAGQAAVFLSQKAKHVYLVVRGGDLRKTMSSYLASRIERSDRVTILTNCEVCDLHGDDYLSGASIIDRRSGEIRKSEIGGMFVMIGAVPHTEWLPDKIARDEKGFIITGQDLVERGLWTQSRPPFFLETSCQGVFAAGDARTSSVKRVASAVGEGSMAVAFVHQFLAL
jgi:thioredoxin reductase (NADPH)